MLKSIESHRRLIAAMAVSSLIIASLLGVLAWLLSGTECSDSWCLDEQASLTIHLEKQQTENISTITLPGHEPRITPQETTRAEERRLAESGQKEGDGDPRDATDTSAEKTPVRDWYAISAEAGKQSIEDRFQKEEIRERMWRKTGSVMFRDTGEFDFQEPETIIAAREFRRPVGVLGIGITIGGCFFGIPLAGIPVDERSAGPNVIYCTDIYE